MPRPLAWLAALAVLFPLVAGADSPLAFEGMIRLPEARGRIDHVEIDIVRKRLFVTEHDDDALAVIDLVAARQVQRITGLAGPQGVGYVGSADRVFVANGRDGSVRVFRGGDFTADGTVALGTDADDVRIDPRNDRVLVGYGTGGLAVLDPRTLAKRADVKLPAHPEGFQLDPVSGKVFVNLPDVGEIAAIDLDAGRIAAAWRNLPGGGNFPMALDPDREGVGVVFRSPPRFGLFDAASGAVRAMLPSCADADDLFLDLRRTRFYALCGAGEIDTAEREAEAWQRLSPVRTAIGTRTGLFVPQFDRLYVARPAAPLKSDAAILVFRPVP